MRINRRNFVCGCSAAVAATYGARFNSLSFGMPGQENDMVIVVSLRGGIDGLNFLVPSSGADRGHYETARPDLVIPANQLVGIGDPAFGLHPSAVSLQEVFQDNGLALVHATGLADVNRSHFEATRRMELGNGQDNGDDGWLTRHLATAAGIPPDALMPALAVSSQVPLSLLGEYRTVNFSSPYDFNINSGHWNWEDEQRLALQAAFEAGDTWMHTAGAQAKIAMDIIDANLVNGDPYVPANGAVYPENNGRLGEYLRYVAQLIKLDLGLQVATIEYGGWDTHEGQGTVDGYYAGLVQHLSEALTAFYKDLDDSAAGNPLDRTTIVVISEFGREVRQNENNGTEHGFGNPMMVLGGPVNGGIWGSFPGLHPDQLFEGTDVEATTDYRRILAEIVTKRLNNQQIDQVFPGYTGYTPMGLIQGQALFADGFESGDLGAWSATSG